MQAMHRKHCTCKKAKVDESHTIHAPQLALKFNVPHLFSDHLVTYTADALLDLPWICYLNLLILKMDVETSSEKVTWTFRDFQLFSWIYKIVHTEATMKIKRFSSLKNCVIILFSLFFNFRDCFFLSILYIVCMQCIAVTVYCKWKRTCCPLTQQVDASRCPASSFCLCLQMPMTSGFLDLVSAHFAA